jgi:plasmid stability protein
MESGGVKMDNLLIEDIDDDLVRDIQMLADRHGCTFDEEAIRLLELGLAAEKLKAHSLAQSAGPKS